MIEIVPAVLPHTLEELKDGLMRLRGLAPLVQIDLVEENVLAGQESPPFWEEFDFEFDLMTKDSLADARSAVALGASRVVVHADFPQAKEALDALQQTRSGDYPVLVGLALRAHDEPDVLNDFVNLYDYVQVMGIDEVGKQGQPPDPHHEELDLIKKLRALFPDLVVQVDGAVAPHVRELVDAGASRLVIGSAILNADDAEATYKELYTLANANG